MFVPKSIECLRRYDRSTFGRDLAAGLTVGVVALPLAMAFAIASGAPPDRGLVTAIVAGFLVSALGGSRVQIGGPTGAFVVIVAGVISKYGYDGLLICTMMAGALLIAMGLARFGAAIKFIPFPVVTGFTSGIALVIFSTQIRDLLGLTMDEIPPEFIPKWIAYGRALSTINWAAAGVGLGTVALIAALRKWAPKVPGMLAAMLAATAVAIIFGLPVETIGERFVELPRSLPAPSLPHLEWSQLREYAGPAMTIALLAAIESLLSATVADGVIGSRHKSNMELVAQGAANIVSPLFGGIPATGAIARTMTNIKSGGRTPIAGMIHAATLLLILLAAGPLAAHVPLAALAGILVVVSYNMSEARHFRYLLRAPRSDVVVLVSTFLITVLVDLTVAVQAGVVMAALLFMRRMSELTQFGVITRELKDVDDPVDDPDALERRVVPPGVEVYEIRGPLFFGAADRFKDVASQMRQRPRVLILRMRHVPAVDATALELLRELHAGCKKDGSALVLSGLRSQPLRALEKIGLAGAIGEDNLHVHIDSALERARAIAGAQ